MTTHFGDFRGSVTSTAEAYPISYSGAGLFDMSPLAAEMMDLLPSYFFLGNNNRKILELIATVLKEYQDNIDEVRDQFFVETATWGLKYWESLVGCPVLDGNTDYEARRACILQKLRDCSSEKCFVEGIEAIINGQAIVLNLNPVTHPYQINIELKSPDITYSGPSSNPTAAVSAPGNLDGDYTYRVTYEFPPVNLPGALTLFPYTNTSGIFGAPTIVSERQFLSSTGSGSFYLTLPLLQSQPNPNAGPFTDLSTAQEIVDGLNVVMEQVYGPDAVSTPFGDDVLGTDGVVIIFSGASITGQNLPDLQVVNNTTIAVNVVQVNEPEFFPPEVVGETPSGIAPTKINEVQLIGQGLFSPAAALVDPASDMIATASASMFGSVTIAGQLEAVAGTADTPDVWWWTNHERTIRGTPALALGTSSVTLDAGLDNVAAGDATGSSTASLGAYVDTSTPLSEIGDGSAAATASASLTGAVQIGSTQLVVVTGQSLADMADGTGPLSLLITPKFEPLEHYAAGQTFATASASLSGAVQYNSTMLDPSTSTSSATMTAVLNPPPPPPATLPITGGDFTISYNPVWDEAAVPFYETTGPLPHNATASQVEGALQALPSIYPNSLVVTGGPLPLNPIRVEFVRTESGFPQALFIVDSSGLLGGGFYEVVRSTAGATLFSGAESNTVTASNESVLLTNVPRSPDGAIKRNIYRKKTEAPYNEWRYVGSIDDNITTVFIDDLPDTDLSEVQEVQTFGTGTFRLRVDGVDTVDLSTADDAATVEAAIDAIVTPHYPDVDVSVTGTSSNDGLVVVFDGGDVVGKDVPQMEITYPAGVTGYVITTGPRKLTETNTAFTFTFERLLQYIQVTKPAHLRVRELRTAAFRASINVAGDPV